MLSEKKKTTTKTPKKYVLKFLDKNEKFVYNCIYVIKNKRIIVNSATNTTNIIPSKLNKKPKMAYDITNKMKYKNLKRIGQVKNK